MSTAGELRHRIVLQQRAQEPDGSTGIAESYTDVETVWAKVEATRGAVYVGAIQVGQSITHRIVTRWRSPTDFSHLATADGTQRWRVRDSRDPDGRRRWLEVMAEELSLETP